MLHLHTSILFNFAISRAWSLVIPTLGFGIVSALVGRMGSTFSSSLSSSFLVEFAWYALKAYIFTGKKSKQDKKGWPFLIVSKCNSKTFHTFTSHSTCIYIQVQRYMYIKIFCIHGRQDSNMKSTHILTKCFAVVWLFFSPSMEGSTWNIRVDNCSGRCTKLYVWIHIYMYIIYIKKRTLDIYIKGYKMA